MQPFFIANSTRAAAGKNESLRQFRGGAVNRFHADPSNH